MSSIWSINPAFLTFPFLLNDHFTSFSTNLSTPHFQLVSWPSTSLGNWKCSFQEDVQILSTSLSSSKHLCSHILPASAHQSPWFSEHGPRPVASGALGTCEKCRFTGHITELCIWTSTRGIPLQVQVWQTLLKRNPWFQPRSTSCVSHSLCPTQRHCSSKAPFSPVLSISPSFYEVTPITIETCYQ